MDPTTTMKHQHLLHPQPDPTIQNISHRFSKLYINHKKKKNLSQPTTITTLTVDSNPKSQSHNKIITTTNTTDDDDETDKPKKETISIKKKDEEIKKKEDKLVVPYSSQNKNVSRRRKSFTSTQLCDFFSCAGVKVVAVDMPPFMQIHAVDCARKAHDSLEKFTSKTLALTIKKEFDGVYGPAWHCIVGTSFGSFVTHSVGGFMYFSMDHKLYILLFKTTVQRAAEPELTPS